MFENLLVMYSSVIPNDNICKLFSVFNYYYANEIKNDILVKNVFRIDIKSAFPTICKILFKDNKYIINKLESLTTKNERNIFIATHLKNYLIDLNNYSKMVIFGYVYNNYSNVEILEYQKDGILFSGEEMIPKIVEFNDLLNSNFKFNFDLINTYIRFNNTSIYYVNNGPIEVKGKYKNPPNKLFLNDNLSEIKKIYSYDYFNVSRVLNINLNNYIFDSKYYLDKHGNRVTDIDECFPLSYLRYFLYPTMFLKKIYTYLF
jgi:hypothetical protein